MLRERRGGGWATCAAGGQRAAADSQGRPPSGQAPRPCSHPRRAGRRRAAPVRPNAGGRQGRRRQPGAAGHPPRARHALVELEQLLPLLKGPQEGREGAHVHGVARDGQQVVHDARELAAGGLGRAGWGALAGACRLGQVGWGRSQQRRWSTLVLSARLVARAGKRWGWWGSCVLCAEHGRRLHRCCPSRVCCFLPAAAARRLPTCRARGCTARAPAPSTPAAAQWPARTSAPCTSWTRSPGGQSRAGPARRAWGWGRGGVGVGGGGRRGTRHAGAGQRRLCR
jgi:hypothetical protein